MYKMPRIMREQTVISRAATPPYRLPTALFHFFAALIAYGTRCLACRLAGSLAFAAAAFFHGLFVIPCA